MEQRRFSAWQRLGLAISGTGCTVLLMQTASALSFGITAVLSLLVLLGVVRRTTLPEALFAPRPGWLTVIAGLLAAATVYNAKSTFFTTCWGWMHRVVTDLGLPEGTIRLVPWIVALVALPMCLGGYLWFCGRAWELGRRLWQESDFVEQMFFLGAGIIFAVMIVFTYTCTQAFYGAHLGGSWYNFDLIYSADSGYLVNQDVYRNVGAEQNDLRQPLFGLFAMPFAHGAWLLSRLLWFIPNSYLYVWQIMQMLLFLVGVVLLSRMLELQGMEKGLFLTLTAVCYPTLIFALTAEQYLVAVFYLILLLYLRQEPGKEVRYIAATGTLLTSGVWFPIVTWEGDLRKFVKSTLGLCAMFFGVTIVSGRFTTFLDIPSYIAGYAPYTGASVDQLSKLRQFVNFAGACVLAPASGPDMTSYRHISWQMLPVTGWSVVGLVVIALAVGGICVSWRSRFTKDCCLWLAFALCLLGIMGWGTVDNGLMLYTLYFGWAFLAMGFRLVDRVLARVRPVKLALLFGLTIGVLLYNVNGLRSVLVFAAQFYPALGGIS